MNKSFVVVDYESMYIPPLSEEEKEKLTEIKEELRILFKTNNVLVKYNYF